LAVLFIIASIFSIKDGLFPGSDPIHSTTIEEKPPVESSEINHIEFEFNQGNDKISLIRSSESNWIFQDQPQKIIPQDEIELIFSLYNKLSVISETALPADLSRLGLDPPVARLSLTSTDGSILTLEIGKLDRDSGLYFVKEDSSQPYMADFQTVYNILKTFYLKILPITLSE
jgi:hypothetical protein